VKNQRLAKKFILTFMVKALLRQKYSAKSTRCQVKFLQVLGADAKIAVDLQCLSRYKGTSEREQGNENIINTQKIVLDWYS
jgi:hypothetical protein